MAAEQLTPMSAVSENMVKNPTQKSARENRFAVKPGVIPPSSRVLLFHPDEWEKRVEVACLNRPLGGDARYAFVKQLDGPGDGARDVEARLAHGGFVDATSGLLMYVLVWPSAGAAWFPEVVVAPVAGLLFGITMAFYYRHRRSARKHGLHRG